MVFRLIPYAFAGISLYLLNNAFLKEFHFIFAYYLNDILFPFVYLPLLNCLHTLLFKNVCKLSFKETIIWVFIFSVWFEFITPLYQPKVTADFFDTIAYLCGGIIIYLIDRHEIYFFMGKQNPNKSD